jgi:hypothetical protein
MSKSLITATLTHDEWGLIHDALLSSADMIEAVDRPGLIQSPVPQLKRLAGKIGGYIGRADE